MNSNFDFKYQEPRSIPVVLLLDTSGSMYTDDNIDIMNTAVGDMLRDFKQHNDTNTEIHVAIYTFGPTAEIFLPLSSASVAYDKFCETSLTADGGTPLGAVLTLAKNELLEDRTKITSRSYRPTVILVSDGMPNDGWESALETFCHEGRSSKCYKMALAIGASKDDPSYQMLLRFAGDEKLVFSTKESMEIRAFFKMVTQSTVSRTVSANPNIISEPIIEDPDDDDLF